MPDVLERDTADGVERASEHERHRPALRQLIGSLHEPIQAQLGDGTGASGEARDGLFGHTR